MSTISKLVVEITGKSTGLNRSLSESKKSVTGFARDSIAAFAKVAAAITAAFTAAGTTVLVMINRTAASIDNMVKTAARLGLVTSELQKLRFAAQFAGVSADQLDNSLQFMVRGVSEAAQGFGLASNALKTLGLNAKELSDLSPDAQFRKIADAMRGIASQGDRVALAMRIFGRSGAGMVNLLNESLETTDGMFDRLQLELTDSQGKAVEAFQNAKTLLAAIFTSFREQVTATVAPAFTAMVEAVTGMIERMGGLREASISFGKVIISVAQAGVSSLSFMRDMFEGIGIVVDTIVIGVERFVLVLMKAVDVAKELWDNVKRAIDALGFKSGFGLGEAAFNLTGQDQAGNALTATHSRGQGSGNLVGKFDDIELRIREREEALGQRVLQFNNSGFVQEMDKLKSSLDMIQESAREANAATSNTAAGATASNTVTLNDVRGMMQNSGNNSPQVNINVDAKTRELFNFVVENPEFADRINSRVDSRTQDARRRITR